jgi:hypothetical protein
VVCPNAACVDSLVDRLMHRAEVVRIQDESYRAKEAQERMAARTKQRGQARRGPQGQTMTAPNNAAPLVPTHWSPEQALAVFECLHGLREALWTIYGPQVQQAWRDQLMPGHGIPDFDPDAPL